MVAIKSTLASTLVVAAALPAVLANPSEKLAARDFSASQYQTLVNGDNWTDSWWDQGTCSANTYDPTWSWVLKIPNARSVDGDHCGRSYMDKIKSECNGPVMAWACRYVGSGGRNTAYIDIAADQSCTVDKMNKALGDANTGLTCGTYSDPFGAGSVDTHITGTWRASVIWDDVWWLRK